MSGPSKGLLASTPDDFKGSENVVSAPIMFLNRRTPFEVTNMGVRYYRAPTWAHIFVKHRRTNVQSFDLAYEVRIDHTLTQPITLSVTNLYGLFYRTHVFQHQERNFSTRLVGRWCKLLVNVLADEEQIFLAIGSNDEALTVRYSFVDEIYGQVGIAVLPLAILVMACYVSFTADRTVTSTVFVYGMLALSSDIAPSKRIFSMAVFLGGIVATAIAIAARAT